MSEQSDVSASGDSDGIRRGDGTGPGDRMVRSATTLFARDGLRATGMREIADHAEAPRGSIRHHFPRGKDQLTLEALAWIGGSVRAELDRATAGDAGSDDPDANADISPGERRRPARGVLVLDRFVDMWRQGLLQTHVASGCSVAAVVHDSENPVLMSQAARVFASWREPFQQALLTDDVPEEQASALATTVIAALEGAVILSRANRDIAPLEQTAAVLRDLLVTAPNPT